MSEIEYIIDSLELQPHPEGGFFKEVYRSPGRISQNELGVSYKGDRNYSTAIYFLLTSETFSAFHRINQDEIWHFYKGSPIRLHTISQAGKHTEIVIGSNIEQGETPQYIVSGQDWFAAEVITPNSYALVGCTVAPGFDFKDFELPERKTLITKFPQHAFVIERLSR